MSKSSASNGASQVRARRVSRLPFYCQGESRARQSFKEECDINYIMRRFEKTGVLEHVRQHGGRYGDFLDVPQDYHEACNQVLVAEEMFLTLPAKVRKAFSNDPGELLAAVDAARNGDAEQVERLQRIGLLQTAEPATPAEAPAGARQGATGEPGTAPKGSGTSGAESASGGS